MKELSKRLQLKPTTYGSVTTIDMFIGHLFKFRNDVHLAHLSTESYAAHKALDELYSEMLDIIDTLAESAQTSSLLNIEIPASKTSSVSPVSLVENILMFVRSSRSIFPHSFQQNEIDNLERVLSSTIYKLKFLK